MLRDEAFERSCAPERVEHTGHQGTSTGQTQEDEIAVPWDLAATVLWEKQHSRSLKLNILGFERQGSCSVGVKLNSESLLRELQKAGNWHTAAHSRLCPAAWFILS